MPATRKWASSISAIRPARSPSRSGVKAKRAVHCACAVAHTAAEEMRAAGTARGIVAGDQQQLAARPIERVPLHDRGIAHQQPFGRQSRGIEAVVPARPVDRLVGRQVRPLDFPWDRLAPLQDQRPAIMPGHRQHPGLAPKQRRLAGEGAGGEERGPPGAVVEPRRSRRGRSPRPGRGGRAASRAGSGSD